MSWLQLILETDADRAPHFAALLEQSEAAAVTFQDSADQPLYEPPPGATPLWQRTRVVALYPAATDTAPIIAALALAIAPEALPAWRIEALEERDWNRAWMEGFAPQRYGERLWIVPSWHTPPEPHAVNLLLDPGLAFGTGSHPTTRLCLEWLDRHPPTGATLIDYGCGSGILALAAAALGAAEVHGVDNDPQALLATRDNRDRNATAGGEQTPPISTWLPEQLPPIQADVVIANILANPLIELADRLCARLRPGGQLVLSGILAEQADQVIAAYAGAIHFQPIAQLDEWVRLDGVRY